MPYRDKTKQREYWRNYQRGEKRVAYKREWNVANRARMAEKQRKRVAADPEKFKTYWRNRYIFKTYGLTPEMYDQMFAAQGGLCGICGSKPDAEKHGYSQFAVDHCHKTNKIRGLLCNPCNAGMGLIGDTVEHLLKAVEYLQKQ